MRRLLYRSKSLLRYQLRRSLTCASYPATTLDRTRIRVDDLQVVVLSGLASFSWLLMTAALAGCSGSADSATAPSALDARAEALLGEGQTAEAKALFGQGAANPRSAFWSYLGLARVSLAERDPAGFDRAIQEAVRRTPPAISGVDALGRTFLYAAQSESGSRRVQHANFATYFLGQARRLDPDWPELGYHTGLALHLAGKPGEALRLLELTRQERGESPHLLLALSRVLRELRRPADIVTLLQPHEERNTLTLDLISELERARAAVAKAGPPSSKPTPP